MEFRDLSVGSALEGPGVRLTVRSLCYEVWSERSVKMCHDIYVRYA